MFPNSYARRRPANTTPGDQWGAAGAPDLRDLIYKTPMAPFSRSCNKCGARGLEWMEANNDSNEATQWRLVDAAGQLHDCHGKPATAEDFK